MLIAFRSNKVSHGHKCANSAHLLHQIYVYTNNQLLSQQWKSSTLRSKARMTLIVLQSHLELGLNTVCIPANFFAISALKNANLPRF